MRAATYGRMRPGRCISDVSLDCKADVLPHMDKVCTGRKVCKIDVNDLEKVAQPCSKDYKAYLEAEYQCVRGEWALRFTRVEIYANSLGQDKDFIYFRTCI